MKKSALAVAVTMACVLATGASGQTAPLDQKEAFNGFLQQPAIQNQLQRMLNDREPAPLKAECATLNIVEAKEYQIVQQPIFAIEGGLQFKSGAWVSVFVVDRCGQKARRRLLIRYIPQQNRLEPTPLMPGDFFGDIRLEVDAIRIVLPGLMAMGKCSDQTQAYILDVHSLGPRVNGTWSEVWKAQTCGNIVSLQVNYVSSQSGTDVTTAPFTLH